MRQLMMTVLALMSVYFLTFSAGRAEDQLSLKDLAWLSGCWEDQRSGRSRDETWTKASGGTMLGVGRMVREGKTLEFEFMRLHEEPDGIYYTAKPSGQAEASFKLVSLKNDTAIFENPQHDFPQRVIYGKQPDGSLLARIEGKANGKERGIDFPFKRAKCD